MMTMTTLIKVAVPSYPMGPAGSGPGPQASGAPNSRCVNFFIS